LAILKIVNNITQFIYKNMAFLTDEKLVIVGAAGMIGSNMVQSALMMGLTSNICLFDVFSPEGVAEEMRQSGFDNVNITATTDVKEAFTGAKYIISSGGAPRKEGMTREDLLAGNCKIAEELGKNIKAYCPDVKHVVIIFNPADLTGLVTLLYSGLKPGQVTTLAGLDTTRLQSALAKKFGVMQSEITGCATYGGHGEQMAVFGSAVKVAGKPLNDLIGTAEFPAEEWEQMKKDVTQGGAAIIKLRGRSSFQSPSYLSVEMIRSVMGGEPFRFPAGTYVSNEKYNHIMMAMDTVLDKNGCSYKMPVGTADEIAKLDASYEHLCKMRDELVTLGIVPAISEWSSINPNL
jgi:malate dehydrogenase